jgi:ribosomal protein L29
MFSVVKNELFKVKMQLAVGSTQDKSRYGESLE